MIVISNRLALDGSLVSGISDVLRARGYRVTQYFSGWPDDSIRLVTLPASEIPDGAGGDTNGIGSRHFGTLILSDAAKITFGS